MSPLPAGASVKLHRSARPPTRAAAVTAPPVTARAWSRISAAVASMAALNSIRKLNAATPSWDWGSPSKPAVSRTGA